MARARATVGAVGLAFERFRNVNDAINTQLVGTNFSTWWALSDGDHAGTIPEYISIWVTRHKYKNGRAVSGSIQLHKNVRFMFRGPVEIAEKLLKSGTLVKLALSEFERFK